MNMNKENHLFFILIMTPFSFYKNMLNFQADLVLIKMGLYWPNFSLVFLIHLFLYAGVYCNLILTISYQLVCFVHHQIIFTKEFLLKTFETSLQPDVRR